MDKVIDSEIIIKFKPNENFQEFFYPNYEKIKEEIANFIEEKYEGNIKFNVNEKFGIDFFTELLIQKKNFTFVKYGDGELLCMLGADGSNCDLHPYSQNLKEKLLKSFKYILSLQNVYLADWKDNLVNCRDHLLEEHRLTPKLADYECFLTLNDNIKNNKLLNFFTILKKSKRKKILIGPQKLENIVKMLNIDVFHKVPKVNAFSCYEELKKKIISNIENDSIYLMCCSMMSCVLCDDILTKNKDLTILDIGSGFDPIFNPKSRPKQPIIRVAQNYFKPIIPSNLIINKFNQAQNILCSFTQPKKINSLKD